MTSISLDDRGLQYGDGLFETLRFSGVNCPLWDWHMQRLQAGCARLGLPAADDAALRAEAERLARAYAECIVKLILTAGPGARGYKRPQPVQARSFLSAQALPPELGRDLRLRWCEMRYARQPRLAGIKHLNRMEQVLARNEWSTDEFDEGLMRDSADQVVSATAANVFVRHGARWRTPAVDQCGIAGIGRRWMLEKVAAEIVPLSEHDLLSSDQCMLTNALRGPRAARSLGSKIWQPDAQVRELQAQWSALFSDRESG